MKVTLLSYNDITSVKKILSKTQSSNGLLKNISFTFAIEGISRACSHQLVRHRVAAFSQQSQRYIEVKELDKHIITPPSISEKNPRVYNKIINEIKDGYEQLLSNGVLKEDARFVLPNATETNLLMTMNGFALRHFFGLRCCNRAQWEIKEIADKMLWIVRDIELELFTGMGPYCFILGFCPEGRFTCGKIEEVRKKYGPSEN